MPDFHSQILSLTSDVLLLVGALKLTIELVIPLVTLFKKLKATVKSEYSLESGRLEVLTLNEREVVSKVASERVESEVALVKQPLDASVEL